MIGLDIIKQTIEDNSQKPVINPEIANKIAMARIATEIKLNFDWFFRDAMDRINNSKISEEDKSLLFSYFKGAAYGACEKLEKELNELFGSEPKEEKQASVESEEEKEEPKEEKKEEDESTADEDEKDDKKTPAEHVIETKPAQVVFNY